MYEQFKILERALPSFILALAARQCGLDVICRTLRERKSRLTPRRVTILPLLFPPSTCLCPPGIARGDKISFIIRARRPRPLDALLEEPRQKLSDESASCMRIFTPVSSLDEDDQRARFGGVREGKGEG